MNKIRCAIYTRKSTEERLDMQFNSLEAQRDACIAYIASQVHAGWNAIKHRFDDPGFSGGTLERPALKRLMEKVRARDVDVILVHKVDRLTRSLADFAKIAELFDHHGVSFVSVTQHLDTSTSMGRLSLNVLLSFAQFEREIASERIREKIHASRKRGLWIGGRVPLGYKAVDKKLIVSAPEAELVRAIFKRYTDAGSVTDLLIEWQSGRFPPPNYRQTDGIVAVPPCPSRGAIYTILRNPIYVGKVRCEGALVVGVHDAIVDQALWERAQSSLDLHRRIPGTVKQLGGRALLGQLYDDAGARLTRSHTVKKDGSRYHYYVSANSTRNTRHRAKLRIPCFALEKMVRDRIVEIISDTQYRVEWAESAALGTSAFNAVVGWDLPKDSAEREQLALAMIERIEIMDGSARMTLSPKSLFRHILGGDRYQETRPITSHVVNLNDPMFAYRGEAPRKQIICRNRSQLKRRADGKRWFALLATGKAKSMYEIAAMYGVSQPTVSRAIAEALEV